MRDCRTAGAQVHIQTQAYLYSLYAMLALGHFDDGVKVGVSLAFANVQRRANGTLQVSVSST